MPVEILPSSKAKGDHQRVVTSSKRPKDALERPNAILNPAMDQDSATFNSIASAFDFQHHLGSDPSAELRVVKSILLRECLISHLEDVCCDVRKRGPRRVAMRNQGSGKPLGENAEEIIQLLSRTRDTTVAVIEAIAVWRGETDQHPPSPFLWHGENYLIKITNDMNFLAGVEPLSTTLKIHPARLCRNPLMLPKTLDEQRRDGELVETSDDSPSPRVGKRRRLYNAAQILLDEESLQRERELVRQKPEQHSNRGETSPLLLDERHDLFQLIEETKGAVKLPSRIRGVSSSSSVAKHVFPIRSVEDNDGVQRIHKLSSWHKKARSQLISLSRSPADDQYLLHSSRFWNREELVYGVPGHQSPPSRRRSPGPGRSKRYALTRSVSERVIDDVILRGKGLQEVRLVRPDRIPHSMGHYGQDIVGSHEGAARTREVDGGCKVQTNAVDSNQPGGDDTSQEGEVKPFSLANLTAQDIQSLLEEKTPIPAAVVVCAAVAFLLSPDEKLPEGFLWPQGFKAVALPVDEFIDKLHAASRGAVSPFKARVLKPIMQREDILPNTIERQGQHAVACLCAWALENLQACEEFREWSHFALKTWYETQQSTNRVRAPEAPQDSTGVEPRATIFYKALHRLPGVGSSFVISLFEDSDRSGGVFVRAFDRASSETFWLPLSVKQLASFGSNANRSPTRLASALARTLTMKRVGATGARRLVIPPIKFRKSGVVCNVAKDVRVKVSSGNTVVVGLPGVKPGAMKSIRVSEILQQTRSSEKAHRPLHCSSGRSKMDGDSPKGSSRHGKIAKDSPQLVETKPKTPMTSVSIGKENMASLPSVDVQTKEARNRRRKEQGASPSLCKTKRDGQGKLTSARRSPKPDFGQGGVKWDNGRQAPAGARAKKIPAKDFAKYDNGRAVCRKGDVQRGMKDKAVADASGNINSLPSDGEVYEDDFEDGDGGM